MRLLWIAHDVLEPFFPHVKGNPTRGGSWIDPLFFSLASRPGIELGIIAPVRQGSFQHKEIEGIQYYSVPIRPDDNGKTIDGRIASSYLQAIDHFKPDLIHVHGTEVNFGLLRKFIPATIPLVCSIQGIITAYEKHLYSSVAAIPYKQTKSVKNWLGRGGIDGLKRKWKRYKRIEEEIFRINSYFIGRTLWDKAQTMALNPQARYYHGEELLRPAFSSARWELDRCEPHSIFISSGAYPIKGLHVLLKAIHLLRNEFPAIKLYVPLSNIKSSVSFRDRLVGEDYSIYIRNLLNELGLHNQVTFLQRLSADEMAKRFSSCHVFALPSFIENSPNSLGEAMMVGSPSVVSFSGGTGSIVQDEESALYFPCGDHETLAFQLSRIFSDPALAQKISRNAKAIALKRHDTEKATDQYLNIYKDILSRHASAAHI